MSESASYASILVVKKTISPFVETEQFIEDLYPVNLIYSCQVVCNVIGNGWRPKPISVLLNMYKNFYHTILKSDVRCHIQIAHIHTKSSGKSRM